MHVFRAYVQYAVCFCYIEIYSAVIYVHYYLVLQSNYTGIIVRRYMADITVCIYWMLWLVKRNGTLASYVLEYFLNGGKVGTNKWPLMMSWAWRQYNLYENACVTNWWWRNWRDVGVWVCLPGTPNLMSHNVMKLSVEWVKVRIYRSQIFKYLCCSFFKMCLSRPQHHENAIKISCSRFCYEVSGKKDHSDIT